MTTAVQYTMVMKNSLPSIVLSLEIPLMAEEQPIVSMYLTVFSPITLQLMMVEQSMMLMLRIVLSLAITLKAAEVQFIWVALQIPVSQITVLAMMVAQSLKAVQSTVLSQTTLLKTMAVQYTMVMKNSLPLIVLSLEIPP